MEILAKRIAFQDQLEIRPTSCWHMGARACDEKAISSFIRDTLDRPNCFVYHLGDAVDLVIRQDKKRFTGRTVKKEFLDDLDSLVNAQTKLLVDTLSPLAKAGRLLGLAEGNHEAEFSKRHGYNITKEVCQKLNVPYLGYSFLMRLTLTRPGTKWSRNFTVYGHHGHGGGKTEGASLNILERMMLDYHADLYTMGHTHKASVARRGRIGITSSGDPRMQNQECILLAAGTFLKTVITGETTYSEQARYPVRRIGYPTLEISWKKDYLGGSGNGRIGLAYRVYE